MVTQVRNTHFSHFPAVSYMSSPQFSLLAFMILVKKKELAALSGVMLPLTVFAKLAGTRLVKFRFDR